MKTNPYKSLITVLFLGFFSYSSLAQTYEVRQDFEAGGTGTDGCWRSYSQSATPSTNNFFTTSAQVKSGTKAGGMYACCGGAASNTPTYYTSPVLPQGEHPIVLWVRQTSHFDEDFEIGTVSDSVGSGFALAHKKSVWPFPVAWEKISISVPTTATQNRIAFRIPPPSGKTYYMDSIVIGNSGNANAACLYSLTTSIKDSKAGKHQMQAYPNPFSNQLTFSGVEENPVDFCLFNAQLQKVLVGKLEANQVIPTDFLQKGLYFITLSQPNKLIYSGKLLKE